MGKPFASYDSFSSSIFGGSQAYVVSDASSIPHDLRQSIAKEFNAPATCFIDGTEGNTFSVQFFSTLTELPMCGHGTVGLMTRLDEMGLIDWRGQQQAEATLNISGTDAHIELQRQENGRIISMLGVNPPEFRVDEFDPANLAGILGITQDDLSADLPIETAVADFVHLIVPVKGISSMRSINPDFPAIVSFCKSIGVQTIATFSTETEVQESNIHVRDFCPAVGVAESAAAGTTNAALTGYLIRNNLIQPDRQGNIRVIAEQGMEINRPSTISTRAGMVDGRIAELKVGGIASKVTEGTLLLPQKMEMDESE